MWDDDFYRFFRNSRNRTNPFRYNDSYTFNLDKFFNHLPFEAEEEKTPPKFKAVKYVTIIVSEGDDDGDENDDDEDDDEDDDDEDDEDDDDVEDDEDDDIETQM